MGESLTGFIRGARTQEEGPREPVGRKTCTRSGSRERPTCSELLESIRRGWTGIACADTTPDCLVVMPCGFDLERTEKEMYWLAERPEWKSLRAVKIGQVYLTDGNQYPRVETLQILAEILHPDLYPPDLESAGWKAFETRGSKVEV